LPLVFGLVLAALSGIAIAATYITHQVGKAYSALADARALHDARHEAEAVRVLKGGLALVEDLPLCSNLTHDLKHLLNDLERACAADDLHALVERIRSALCLESVTKDELFVLDQQYRRIWSCRVAILASLGRDQHDKRSTALRADLLDLAILGSELRIRAAPADQTWAAYQEALHVLHEAQTLLGSTAALARELEARAEIIGLIDEARTASQHAAELTPHTAWEHTILGRALLRRGRLNEAFTAFERALESEPGSFWANFYRGQCAYRLGRFDDSITAFTVCVALAPERASCVHNRGLAYVASAQPALALRDFTRALALDPSLSASALSRGAVYCQQGQHDEALRDLQHALELGADKNTVRYTMALVHVARRNHDAALECLSRIHAGCKTFARACALRDALLHDDQSH
jgi:tetratricopeptide (TPR) repeat protein